MDCPFSVLYKKTHFIYGFNLTECSPTLRVNWYTDRIHNFIFIIYLILNCHLFRKLPNSLTSDSLLIHVKMFASSYLKVLVQPVTPSTPLLN